ncbi:MAG: hypothetical protein KC910_23545 [Candidatus Eremiobacteraeota bacterium]|nr:hypothetical protein [Candidatus Eremiobacteraeota bacterium]
MQIELTLNGQTIRPDIAAGMLLSDLLEQEGCPPEGGLVLVDGMVLDARIRLAAQAHGRTVDTRVAQVQEPVSALVAELPALTH